MRSWVWFCHISPMLPILQTLRNTFNCVEWTEFNWFPAQHQLSRPLHKTSVNIFNIHPFTFRKTCSVDPHLTEEELHKAKNRVTSPSSLSCSLATRHFTPFLLPQQILFWKLIYTALKPQPESGTTHHQAPSFSPWIGRWFWRRTNQHHINNCTNLYIGLPRWSQRFSERYFKIP